MELSAEARKGYTLKHIHAFGAEIRIYSEF